jgi:hypothetical protein
MKLKRVAWLLFGLPYAALAWDGHEAITRLALRDLAALKGRTVPVTSFQDFLRAVHVGNALAFNEELRIRKDYGFAFKQGEAAGKSVPLLDVLSFYSDEPDWGMDQELFGNDQYPELWKFELLFMGGKRGLSSQSFRHMYWRTFDPFHPLTTFKLPKVIPSMGEAPARAALFIDWSRRAKSQGHAYWAARFLANSLHYLQDCAQPYHATQVPDKSILLWPFTSSQGEGFHHYVAQVTQIISYHHLAFEDYVSSILRDPKANAFGARLKTALTGSVLSEVKTDIHARVVAMARLADGFASRAEEASAAFFPEITVPFSALDVKKFMDETWRSEVRTRGQRGSLEDYFSIVEIMFREMGNATRSVVHTEEG